MFLKCLLSLFNILLIFAAILVVILFFIENLSNPEAAVNGWNFQDAVTAFVIVAVVLCNSLLEFTQLRKSQGIVNSFMNMIPSNCAVIRSGELKHSPASDLVVGDVVMLRMGDKVPADLLLFACAGGIKVDNSCLTGESDPQERIAFPQGAAPAFAGAGAATKYSGGAQHQQIIPRNPLEAPNIAFNSTLVVRGECYGIVIRTSDDTMIGQIAGMTQAETKRHSPLNQEITRFVHIIAFVAVVTATVFFVFMSAGETKFKFADRLTFAIGVLLAWVPQGLPLTVTMLLTIASKRMAKKSVVVKSLFAVETLGAITMLATDKTGTLTKNQMTVASMWTQLNKVYTSVSFISSSVSSSSVSLNNNNNPPTQSSMMDPNTPGVREILLISAMCSSAKFDSLEKPLAEREIYGDATESGLFRLAANTLGQAEFDALASKFRKLYEVPFNSETKIHFSVHEKKHPQGNLTVFVKGAPERVLRLCRRIIVSDSSVADITDDHRRQFDHEYGHMASMGHRVLAFARLELDSSFDDIQEVTAEFEKRVLPLVLSSSSSSSTMTTPNLTFVGLASLEDPPKHGVREAIGNCRLAGIKVVMVTGDHPLTAEAIGRKINLMTYDTREQMEMQLAAAAGGARGAGLEIDESEVKAVVVHGDQISKLTDDDWDRIFDKEEIIFARTSPRDKLDIVRKAQALGHIVGVTGDGVNDSPALKKADLGIAMNQSGSDVSKEAAAMILMDDNFASVVNGVREGRLIFLNLKKATQYVLTHIIPEVLQQFAFVLFGWPKGLSALQILSIDMGFELFAALSFAYEKPENESLMRLPPRRPVTMQSIDYLRARRAFDAKFKSASNANAKLKSKSKKKSTTNNTAGGRLNDNNDEENAAGGNISNSNCTPRAHGNQNDDDGGDENVTLTKTQKLRQLMSGEYWRSYSAFSAATAYAGECLVDLSVFCYSYFEVGVLEYAASALWYLVYLQELMESEGAKALARGNLPPLVPPARASDYYKLRTLGEFSRKAQISATKNEMAIAQLNMTNADVLSVTVRAQTAYFLALLVTQIFNLFSCKSRLSYPLFGHDNRFGLLMNWRTYITILFGVGVVLGVIYVPGLNTYFESSAIEHWGGVYVPFAFGVGIFFYSILRLRVLAWLFPVNFTPEVVGLAMHPTRWSSRNRSSSAGGLTSVA